MPNITIEYVILLPILILQIMLFPFAVNMLMNIWVDSRRTLALQEVVSHIGSCLQQMYFTLNHNSVPTGKLTQTVDVPPFIEGYHYVGNATLRPVLDPELGSSKVLRMMFRLVGTGTVVETSVILGPSVEWRESTFVSNSTSVCITAEKFANETILLAFGGG
ncbi:hypothetical protein KEJ45_01290 [Candidatus Bathyarchaeota archaeon]|nr:hypothetical protein [Candidatus Bathyarchaeota archaeon]